MLNQLKLLFVKLPRFIIKNKDVLLARYIFRKGEAIGAAPYEIRLHDKFWERYLGINTEAIVDIGMPQDGFRYEATPYLLLHDIMKHLALDARDVFVDLGCGKGRTLSVAARTDVGRVIGLEYNSSFLPIARLNAQKLRGRKADIELREGLAQAYDFDDVTVVFMFNPFGEITVLEVLAAIRCSLDKNPRAFRLVYVTPVHDKVLASVGWLEKYDTWNVEQYPGFHVFEGMSQAVTFWRSSNSPH